MARETKTYPVRWEGRLILACRKCQKKLKGEVGFEAIAKLKKAVKACNRERGVEGLHVLSVPCMDLCPKGGVVVCDVERSPGRLMIVRGVGDVERLYK